MIVLLVAPFVKLLGFKVAPEIAVHTLAIPLAERPVLTTFRG